MERHDLSLTLAFPEGTEEAKLADAIFKLGPRVMEWEEWTSVVPDESTEVATFVNRG